MRPWKVLAAIVLIAALVAAIVWVLVGSPWTRVQAVEIQGASPHRETTIRESVHAFEGKPLVEVNLDEVSGEVNRDNLYAAVDASRAWPSTLVVRVQERTPAVTVRLPDGQFGLVDREGVAYERVGAAPDGVLEATLENPSDQASRSAAAAVGTTLPDTLATRVESLTVDAGGRATFSISGVDVVWGSGADSAVKAAVLEPLLDRGGVARIDLTAPMSPVTSE